MPKHYSEELLEIIRSMLKYEPSSRPSASRILRHAFIKKHIALFLEGTKNRLVCGIFSWKTLLNSKISIRFQLEEEKDIFEFKVYVFPFSRL